MAGARFAGLLTALACLALPAGAGAATVSVQGPSQEFLPDLYTLTVAAAPGEANAVSVSLVGADSVNATWAITDAGAAPDAGAGCTAAGPGRVACTVPKSRLPSGCGRVGCTDYGQGLVISLDLGDGDDSVDLSSLPADGDGGGVVSSDIRGGIGADTLTGGPGPDAIDGDPSDGTAAGADVIDGAGGDDLIRGYSGGDRLVGGRDADTVDGGAGGDRISGGAGPDQLAGAGGGDTLLAAGGGRDGVSCGGGKDDARVDRRDKVSGCEHLR